MMKITYIITIIAFIILPLASAGLLTNHIAYYSFDTDGTNSYNSSYHLNNTNVTLTNTIVINGYNFSGRNYMENVSADIWSNWYAGTVCAWINTTQAGTQSVFSTGDHAGAAVLDLILEGHTAAISYNNGSTAIFTSTTTYNLNQWNHICWGSSGTTNFIWINGQPTSLDIVSNGHWLGDTPNRDSIQVGRKRTNTINQYMIGQIDEVYISSRKLADTEITELYNYGYGYNPNITNYTYNSSLPCDINYTDLITGQNVTLSEHNNTIWYAKNINDTTNETVTVNYTLKTTDFLDKLEFRCDRRYPTVTQYKSQENITEGIINKVITFTILGYLSLPITNSQITTNYTNTTRYTDNPQTIYMSNFFDFGDTEVDVNITATDLSYGHQDNNTILTLNETYDSLNITMESNQITLNFSQSGTNINVSGKITHEPTNIGDNMTYGFNNTQLLILQQSLNEGYVNIRWTNDQNTSNWYQYYEYINNNSNIFENIEVIQNADWTAWIQILDYTGAPIEDALVRVTYAHSALNQWSKQRLLGQRLTTDDGFTFFYADQLTEVIFTITKSGYQPKVLMITIGDESFTRAAPITIYLQESDQNMAENSWFYTDRTTFSNRSQDIISALISPTATTVVYNTNYRITLGLGNLTATRSTLYNELYTINMTAGRDFSVTGTDNVNLTIYVDSVLFNEYQYTYDDTARTKILDTTDAGLTSTESVYLLPILFIAIILASLVVSMSFKSNNAGTGTFMIGTILVGFIQWQFFILTFLFIIYQILKTFKTVTTE